LKDAAAVLEAIQKIIAGIAALASTLGLSFIAEGAETIEQVELLKQLGVEQVQGYYFGKPFAVT
jgi:EAL domain-containing protein (putative c-di-GMP-specific phosphodiesterase class I)